MTVRARLTAAFMLAGLLWVTGCGGGDPAPLVVETDEPLYAQGLQLNRQGRLTEALVSFLKVIEKRGEQSAPESHFEAGLIYLKHTKDYIEAIHHFQRYVALNPNSPKAMGTDGARELIMTAKREFARTLPAMPTENFSSRPELTAELEQLRRENQELRAQMSTLRGGGAMPVNRTARPAINLPPAANLPGPDDSPLSMAPPRPLLNSAPLVAPTPVSTAAPARGGRSYSVEQSDSLWKIGRKVYGNNVTAAKVDGIFQANRDQMKDQGDLKIGMKLRIP